MARAFRVVCVLVLALAFCQAANARPLTGNSYLTQKILRSFKELSGLSLALQSATESVTFYNAPYRAYKISQSILVIFQRIDDAIVMLDAASGGDAPELDDDEAKSVVGALKGFVEAQSDALDAVIDKHGLVTLVPFVEGIRQALLNVAQKDDVFADTLIPYMPTQSGAVNEQFGRLGYKTHEAIAKYEEPLLNAAIELFANH